MQHRRNASKITKKHINVTAIFLPMWDREFIHFVWRLQEQHSL